MNLPKKAVVYIGILVLLAIGMGNYLVIQYDISNYGLLLFWCIIGTAAESFLIILPNGVAVSVLFAINLAAIITGGPLAGVIVSVVSFLCRVVKVRGRRYVHIFNTPPHKTVFNTAQNVLLTGISGIVYIAAGGEVSKLSLLPILLIVFTYVFLNSAIMSVLFSLLSETRFSIMLIKSIGDTLINSVAIAFIGTVLAMAYMNSGYLTVVLFFSPLLIARYSFKLYVEMRNMYMDTIQALNKSMEAKDPYTSGHAMRVQEYAVKLAQAMGLPARKIQNIKTAAILHDIGKIGIDDSILKKPGSLTKEEYMEIQRHTSIGAEILKDVDFLKDIAQIIRFHHERFDGKGYPSGLKGEEIPIEASILAVADVYDAMTSNRPYRDAMDKETALKEILVNAGTQFEPKLAQTFCNMMGMQIAAGRVR